LHHPRKQKTSMTVRSIEVFIFRRQHKHRLQFEVGELNLLLFSMSKHKAAHSTLIESVVNGVFMRRRVDRGGNYVIVIASGYNVLLGRAVCGAYRMTRCFDL